MPGRRCYERELIAHARDAPHRQRVLFELLTTYLPDYDRALVGTRTILDYLHTTLQLRRPSGNRITARMLWRWRRDHHFPLLRGAWRPRYCTPAITSTYAVTAWALAQADTDQVLLFRVGKCTDGGTEGTRPRHPMLDRPPSPPGIGKGRWKRPLAMIEIGERRPPSHDA
jgi:hypothetical protein